MDDIDGEGPPPVAFSEHEVLEWLKYGMIREFADLPGIRLDATVAKSFLTNGFVARLSSTQARGGCDGWSNDGLSEQSQRFFRRSCRWTSRTTSPTRGKRRWLAGSARLSGRPSSLRRGGGPRTPTRAGLHDCAAVPVSIGGIL